MTNEEFLQYVLRHSQTPRHAFTLEDAYRLMDLAKVEEIKVDNCGIYKFVGISVAEANRLIKLAEKH